MSSEEPQPPKPLKVELTNPSIPSPQFYDTSKAEEYMDMETFESYEDVEKYEEKNK